MKSFFGEVRYLPVFFGVAYLSSTILLFFAGPFDWPINNADVLILFLSVCFLALTLGFGLGVHHIGRGNLFESWRLFFRVGGFVSIVLVFPSTWAYTGKWPWDFLSILGDQGLAYREMLAALEENESGVRTYVALARAIFAPFVFCVIPFGILKWKDLKGVDFLLLAGHVCALLIFSVMRGTDRETGDLFVVIATTLLVVVCRAAVARGRFPFKFSTFMISALGLALLLSAAIFLFVDRKESRMGGIEAFCVAEAVVCSVRSANENPVFAKGVFGLEMLTAYVAQGYYGLSLALKEDFSSTYGLGHSAFLMSAFTKAFDDSAYRRSYLAKVSDEGWDDKSQWSTIFPWLASDVSFPAVPVVMAVFGFFAGRAWKSAVLYKSDAGALVFLFLSLFVVYMPANNQLAQTLDSYFAFLFWLILWLSQGASKAGVPARARR